MGTGDSGQILKENMSPKVDITHPPTHRHQSEK